MIDVRPFNQLGGANHGWLKAKHHFSFANYYDPKRMHWGDLRVWNDDEIAAQSGFPPHPHENMEIITYVREGAITHEDSMGNRGRTEAGDVQVMSAGTGVVHSEYNNGKTDLKLLQIWLFPNKQNVKPRYGQIRLNVAERQNRFQQILSPNEHDEGVWIHQDAWFSLGKFDAGREEHYTIRRPGNGVYAFLISGKAVINGQELHARDAYGIWDTDGFDISFLENDTEILLMDVPMELPFAN